MSFCPKCGSKVEETGSFCPTCGTQVRAAVPSQPLPAMPVQEKQGAVADSGQGKTEQPKEQKKAKSEYGFMYYLIAGLVLITVGAFAILELTNPALKAGQYLILMLLTIGIIVIVGAIYVVLSERKHLKHLRQEQPINPAKQPPPQPASPENNGAAPPDHVQGL